MKPDNPDVNIGDPSLYGPVGRVEQLYAELINHRDREMEGAAPGDPLPFSFSEFESLVADYLVPGFCSHCERLFSEWNWLPDHKKPLSVGGTSELSNICIICQDCSKKKRQIVDDAFHRKMFPTRWANRQASAGRSLPYSGPAASPPHTGEVDRAARGIASVPLKDAQTRAYFNFLSGPSGYPKVRAIVKVMLRAFEGELDKRQALKEMAILTGEYRR
jgi:5-methylcytosine-specific restriction endonuclease McrA